MVLDRDRNAERGEKIERGVETAAGQRDMVPRQLRARNDARLVVRRPPHRLRRIKFGVLEGGQTDEAGDQRRGKITPRNIDLIGANQCVASGRGPSMAGGARLRDGGDEPWFFVFIDERHTHRQDFAGRARFLDSRSTRDPRH